MQGVLLFLWLAETVGLALLLFEFIKKMTDVRSLTQHGDPQYSNAGS